jgi:hypothetical protein
MSGRVAILLGAGLLAAGAGAALGAEGSETVAGRATPARAVGSGAVLTRARLESPAAYRRAVRAGAGVAPTPDGRSFYVLWPAGTRGGRVIVTFHGYLSTAFDGLEQWRAAADRAGYAVLAVHWRLGRTSRDSYTPRAMYAQARALLRRLRVAPGHALLHGYSSAASRMYGVAALDSGRLFALQVADAGGALPGRPMYREVFGAPAGRKTLRGTRWVLFCGGRDPDPQLTGCPVMRRTRAKVLARGGAVERFIVDPRSSHGGFHQNPAHMPAVLALFARLSAPQG